MPLEGMSEAAREALIRIRIERSGEPRLIAVSDEYPFGLGWNLRDAREYRREVARDRKAFRELKQRADQDIGETPIDVRTPAATVRAMDDFLRSLPRDDDTQDSLADYEDETGGAP